MNQQFIQRIENMIASSDFDQAKSLLNNHISQNPSDAKALYYRGRVNHKLDDYDLAIDDYSSAIRLQPDNPEYYDFRGLTNDIISNDIQAIVDFSDSIKLLETSVVYISRGESYVKIGEYALAIADFSEAIRLKPENFLTFFNRGKCYDKICNYDLAIADYTVAIRLKPEFSDAYNYRGISYSKIKNEAQAIDDFTKAMNTLQSSYELYFNRGCSHLLVENNTQAIIDFTDSLNLQASVRTYVNRGYCFDKTGDEDHAIRDFSDAISLDPKHSLAYFNRGVILSRKSEFIQAIDDFNKVYIYNREQLPMAYSYLTSQIPDSLREIKTLILILFLNVQELRNILQCLNFGQACHYTNLNCLIELAKGKAFRFYNASQMNDPFEGSVFFNLLEKYMLLPENNTIQLKEDDLLYRLGYNNIENILEPFFIGSYITGNNKEDYLPMWKNYGRHNDQSGTGCCLVFKDSLFSKGTQIAFHPTNMFTHDNNFIDIRDSELSLCKVIYINAENLLVPNDSLFENKIKKVAVALIDVLANLTTLNEDSYQNLIKKLVREILSEVRYFFKSKCYESENEARVVINRMSEYSSMTNFMKNGIHTDYDNDPPRYYLNVHEQFKPHEIILGSAVENFRKWKSFLYSVPKSDINIRKVAQSNIDLRSNPVYGK